MLYEFHYQIILKYLLTFSLEHPFLQVSNNITVRAVILRVRQSEYVSVCQ